MDATKLPSIEEPTLEQLKRAAVEERLNRHGGNKTHTARTLGISIRTLQRNLTRWSKRQA